MSEPVEVVPAAGTLPAPGADNIIGTYQAPNPGAQPGEVAEQPLVAGSAADPDPKSDKNVAPLPHIQTADDPHPEATAKGATDPALHNPRGPLDAEPATDGGGVAAAADPAAPRMPAPQGPAQTQHSQNPVHPVPPRREEV